VFNLKSIVLAQHRVRVLLSLVKFLSLLVLWQGHLPLLLVLVTLWVWFSRAASFLSKVMDRRLVVTLGRVRLWSLGVRNTRPSWRYISVIVVPLSVGRVASFVIILVFRAVRALFSR